MPPGLLRACHAPALIRALLACLCTLLTMRMLMPCALLAAGFADVCAQAAQLLCKVTSPCHVGGSESANSSAVHVQPNALGHLLDVGLLQTGRRAMVARISAGIAGVDAGLMLMMGHT